MMETQSLMKSLFTHISMSVVGCNPSHHLSSLIPTYLLNPLFSFPLLLSCVSLPRSSPFCPTLSSSNPLPCYFHSLPSPSSAFTCYFSPPPLHSPCVMCLFNYSFLHPWRSKRLGVGLERGEGSGQMRRERERRNTGGWMGRCSIIKHRFGMMMNSNKAPNKGIMGQAATGVLLSSANIQERRGNGCRARKRWRQGETGRVMLQIKKQTNINN